ESRTTSSRTPAGCRRRRGRGIGCRRPRHSPARPRLCPTGCTATGESTPRVPGGTVCPPAAGRRAARTSTLAIAGRRRRRGAIGGAVPARRARCSCPGPRDETHCARSSGRAFPTRGLSPGSRRTPWHLEVLGGGPVGPRRNLDDRLARRGRTCSGWYLLQRRHGWSVPAGQDRYQRFGLCQVREMTATRQHGDTDVRQMVSEPHLIAVGDRVSADVVVGSAGALKGCEL